jgi:hypothetical protein
LYLPGESEPPEGTVDVDDTGDEVPKLHVTWERGILSNAIIYTKDNQSEYFFSPVPVDAAVGAEVNAEPPAAVGESVPSGIAQGGTFVAPDVGLFVEVASPAVGSFVTVVSPADGDEVATSVDPADGEVVDAACPKVGEAVDAAPVDPAVGSVVAISVAVGSLVAIFDAVGDDVLIAGTEGVE